MSIPIGIENSILGLAILNQELLAEFIVSDENQGVYYSKIFQKPSNHLWYQITWEDNQSTPVNDKTNIDVRIRTGDLLPYKSTLTNTRYTLDEYNSRIQSASPDTIDADLYKWQLGRSLLGQTPPVMNALMPMQGSNVNEDVFELGSAMNSTKLGVSRLGIIRNEDLIYTGTSVYTLGNIPKSGNVYIRDYAEVFLTASGTNFPTGTNQFKVDYGNGDVYFSPAALSQGISTKITYYYDKDRYDGVWNNWSTPYIRRIGYIANNVNHDYLQLRINLQSLTGNPSDNPAMFKITVSSILDQSNQ